MLLYSGLRGASCWTVLTVVASGGILLTNAIYFIGGPTPRFLLEKGPLAGQAWWLAAFYLHIVAASACLVAGTPLMFPAWTRRHPGWHRLLGYVYLNAVLWIAAPTGLAMSFTAKGGVWSTVGFAAAGILWWYVTWTGYRAIRRGDVDAHVRAMVRSFALALSAPAFRVIQAALFLSGVDDNVNYVLSLWLSLAASVCLAESFLFRARRRSLALWTVPSTTAGVIS